MRFNLNPNDIVRKTIFKWVRNFKATGCALFSKPTERLKTARTPENIVAVTASIEQSV